jgi:outer membrane biosynthesis protein TonB
MLLKFLRSTLITHDGRMVTFGETFEAPEPYASDYIQANMAVEVVVPVVVTPEPIPEPAPAPAPVTAPTPDPEPIPEPVKTPTREPDTAPAAPTDRKLKLTKKRG